MIRHIKIGGFVEIAERSKRFAAAKKNVLYSKEKMEIRPITFKQASEFINLFHRHHKATVGHKFSIGLYDGTHWTGKRNRNQALPREMKQRWSRILN